MRFVSYAERHIKATLNYNLRMLCQYLQRDENDVVYFSKEKSLHSKEDEDLFFITLYYYYRWDYSDFENTTIYLEVKDEQVFGGVYDLITKKKKTRVLIGVDWKTPKERANRYKPEVLSSICKIIQNT